jgi:hypothetical protein
VIRVDKKEDVCYTVLVRSVASASKPGSAEGTTLAWPGRMALVEHPFSVVETTHLIRNWELVQIRPHVGGYIYLPSTPKRRERLARHRPSLRGYW